MYIIYSDSESNHLVVNDMLSYIMLTALMILGYLYPVTGMDNCMGDVINKISSKNWGEEITPCLKYGYKLHFENDRLCGCVLKSNEKNIDNVNNTSFHYERCCEQCDSVSDLILDDSGLEKNIHNFTYDYGSVDLSSTNQSRVRLLPLFALPNTIIYNGLELDCDCNLMYSNNNNNNSGYKEYIYDNLRASNVLKISQLNNFNTPCKYKSTHPIDKSWSCGYYAQTIESLNYCESMRTRNTLNIGMIMIKIKLIL